MLKFIKNLFKKKQELPSPKFTYEQAQKDYELKEAGIEKVLGKMHNVVGHALIPFEIGGAVDMYYFPNHINGTGFATMELLNPDGTGPLPNEIGTYELVAFTKHNYSSDPDTEFSRIERHICRTFTNLGFYSREAVLNPLNTCEVPQKEGEENACLVFNAYCDFNVGDREHHLLLCQHVFRNEMEYAREHGTMALLEKLQAAGYYPYSDLDRPAVV